MSYNNAEIDYRDIIRGRLLDTDPEDEYLPDVVYDSALARHSSWLLAGADIAGRIYKMIAFRPVAIASDGDSMRWSDLRATVMKEEQAAFLSEYAVIADEAGYGQVVTITKEFLTGDRTAVTNGD